MKIESNERRECEKDEHSTTPYTHYDETIFQIFEHIWKCVEHAFDSDQNKGKRASTMHETDNPTMYV